MMSAVSHIRTCALASALVCLALPTTGWHRTDSCAAQTTGHAVALRDGQHDFDFEFGTWKVHLRRLLQPLTGSDRWVEMEGTSEVRRIWNGRANLGELNVSNATSQIQGLSLRLYDPQSRQWSIYWANGKDGRLGEAMIGQFIDGRGHFFNQEVFDGRAVYVRFIFSGVTPTAFRLEQSFSADGGHTWEPNWIATFTRLKP